MLTLLGILGSLVSDVLTGAAGDRLISALKARRGGARSLVDLHNSLVELEDISAELVLRLDAALEKRKPVLYDQWIPAFKTRVERASGDFLRSWSDLYSAISIVEPEVAELLGKVVAGKKAGYSIVQAPLQEATAFRVLTKPSPSGRAELLDCFSYSVPRSRAASLRVLDDLRELRRKNRHAITLGTDLFAEWCRSNTVTANCDSFNAQAMSTLRTVLVEQRTRCREGRAAVQKVISKRLSIEHLFEAAR